MRFHEETGMTMESALTIEQVTTQEYIVLVVPGPLSVWGR